MKNTPQLRSYFKSLMALVTSMRACPATRPHVAMKLTTLFLAVSAAAGLTLSSQAQISVTTTPSVQTFNTLPGVTEWSTKLIGGGAGDITSVAAMDADLASNPLFDAATINVVLPTATDFPVSQNNLARWNDGSNPGFTTGGLLQQRATGVRYAILMATLRNDSGGPLASLKLSYDWKQYNPRPVNESVAGQRVYISLTGAPGSWRPVTSVPLFDNNSPDQTVNASVSLRAEWAAGANLYVMFVDDNGPGSTSNPQEGGYSIDNVSFSGRGAVVLENALNIGGNKIGSVLDQGNGDFTVVGGGNDVWDDRDEFTFAYTELTGDFDVQVRIDSFTPNARWSKAGLMARESLSEYGRMVFPLITPADVATTSGGNGGNYTAMGYRTGIDNAGGPSGGQHEDRDGGNTIGANNLPNAWLRLARIGNVVYSSNSLDGVAWQFVSSQDTATWGGGALPATLNVGLAASRHSGGPTATAEFKSLKFNVDPLAAIDLRRATSKGNPNGILVEFSKPVGGAAYLAASYSVDNGVTITEVQDGPSATTVKLVTSALTEGTSYTVSVTTFDPMALDGSAIGTATTAFVHGAGYEPQTIVLQHNKTADSGYYRNSDAVAKGLGTLIHNGSGGVYPAYQVNGLFEDIVPDNGNNERYSTRIAGVLNITVSGDYNFACSSDDQGFLYLSSDDQPANKVLIANEPAWNGSRSYTTQDRRGASQNRAGPIALVAGQKYYIEYDYTEGGGGNNGSATWQPPGAPAITAGQSPIPASAFMPHRNLNGSIFTTLGSVLVTENPVSQTVVALSPVTFKAKYDGTPSYSYQWLRNGANIPGANGATYTIPVTALGDDGAKFSVKVSNAFSSATSTEATLTILNPAPPHLLSAQVDTTFTKLTVRFDNRVDPVSSTVPGNYSIPGTTVMSATRNANGLSVALVISPALAEGTTYTITVSNVRDETLTQVVDPNPSTASFTTLVFTSGYIQKEFYNQFSGGNVDPFIAAYRAGTINPFRVCLTNLWELNHADILDNYGGRMAGYYIADETGPHVFFIATDDPGRLFISTDETPANLVEVAREPVWSGRRTWTGEAGGGGRVGNPSASGGAQLNTTGPIMMTAGQRYFVESYMTEGGGGDNMAVAVRKPSDAADPVNGSTPVTAANLGMYFDPAGASVSLTQNPVSQTIDENGFATFTIAATGSSPLCGGNFGVRWLKNGVPIPGAIGQSYTFGPASLADNGAVFTAEAAVPGAKALSTPATLNVNVDTNPPVVAIALGSATFDSITLIFNELYNPATAGDLFSYTVTGPGGALNVTAFTLGADGRTVILTTDLQTEDTIYTVDYSLVTDLKGNLASDAGAGAPPALANVRSFVAGCSGVVFDIFRQVGGGTDINILVNHPTFPNSPDETRLLQTFDTGPDFAENYGGRVRGLFIPPTSGAWNLFATADDGSRVFFNPTGPSAAGKVLILEETPGCCTAFAGRQAGPFNLIGGQGYYLEGIYKEAGGGDYIRLAARLASDNTTALAPMPPAWAGVPAAPPGVGGPVNITTQPMSQTVIQNMGVTFSVVASNPNGLPLCYQWKKNGVDIMGANGSSFSYTPVPLSDDGATFQVMVSVIGSRASSAIATLTVLPDLTRPTCVEARGSVSLSNVVVRFSEFMDATSAANNFNYVVDGGAYGVSAVVMNPDGKSVTLSLDPGYGIGSGNHTVTISDVTDLSGNLIDPNPCTLTFSAPIISCGFLYFESFKNIGGADLGSLTANPAYPNSPSEVGYIGGFNSRFFYPSDSLENYGARMRGLFIPPTSGNYIFYIRSDDASRLLLNPTGPDAAGAVVLTEELGCCGNFSGHASAPQALTAGQMYYIEGLYKEGGGGDYMQAAVKLDTDPTNPNDLQPISGNYLATLADPVGASVSITTQPADQLFLINPNGGSGGVTLSSENFDSGDGGCTVANVGVPFEGPWTYDAGSGSWKSDGQGPELGRASSTRLSCPPVTVTQGGIVGITIDHRWSFEPDAGTTGWDGGQILVSVNGGPFTVVPASAFSALGYNGTVLAGSSAENHGQAAFVQQSSGHGAGTLVTSVAALGAANVGDVIRVQFLAANDTNTRNTSPQWEISRVVLTQGGGNASVNFSVVAAGGSTANPNTGIYYQWNRNGVPIPGANGSSYGINPVLADNGAKFSVNVYVPGATTVSREATLTVAQPNTPPVVVCSTTPLPAVMEDAGAQCVPGVLSILSPHSITRATITYGGNFNSGLPPGSAIGGNAYRSADGVLHLTDALNGQQSSFVTPALAAPIDTLTVDFMARVGEGTCCGVARYADGWSLTIGNVSVPVTFPQAAEEGATASGGFVVSFDNWDNGGFGDDDAHTAPNVDVKVGGSVVAYQAFDGEREGGRAPSGPLINDPATMAPMTAFTAGAFVPVRLTLANGKLNVDFKGVRVINDVSIATPLTNTRLAFGARTGGANENMWIDDLSIVASSPDNSAVEAGQTVHVNVTTDRPDLFSVQPTIDANGTLCYTPAPNACGTAHLTAVAMDNGGTAYGGSDSAPACQFDIVIDCKNDCPVGGNQSVTTAEDTSASILLAGSDADGDALTFAYTLPSNGILSGTAPNLTYTPAANYCGADSFTYTVSDGDANCIAAVYTVSITVSCVNDCPVVSGQSLNTDQNVALAIVLAASDVDGGALTYTVTAPAHGTLSGTGANRTYTPALNYAGPDSFSYTVNDGQCSRTAVINITVRQVNECPIARIVVNPLCVTTGAHTIYILANQDDEGCVILDGRMSSDADGNPLTYSWFADGGVLPISVQALTTNCFSIGEHVVTLMVDDGTCIGATNVHFEVVTACDLVENLIADIENSTLPRNKKRPLIASLKKICKIFEKDKKNEFKYAVKKLEAFQKKLKGELKNYPAQQAQFYASAQSIIDGITCAVDLQKKKKQHGH